ncbi:MAG TPA: arsenate reductase family protein [Paracoccaceae bacterium]|nr:arsenate reductase family protein [Paracoccaceae bacterium]
MDVVIHHNAACGSSRNALAIIEAAGYCPIVIDYMSEGWTRPQLLGLFAAAGKTAREMLRERETLARYPHLLRDGVTEEELIAAMVEDPVLVNRPIVCTAKGVRLCRPAEMVLDLLESWPEGPFSKANGTLLIDAEGNRVPPDGGGRK